MWDGDRGKLHKRHRTCWIHCYTSGDTLIYKWGYTAIQVGIHCYTSGDTLLYKWGNIAIQVGIHCYTRGDTLQNP